MFKLIGLGTHTNYRCYIKKYICIHSNYDHLLLTAYTYVVMRKMHDLVLSESNTDLCIYTQ